MRIRDVLASKGGRRYHSHQHCPAFRYGQELWAFNADEWVPGMSTTYLTSGHPLGVMDISEAASLRLRPCTRCRPIRTTNKPDHFGHEPMNVITNGKLRTVECYRCPVPWPCATAVVLDLSDDPI